MILKHKFKKQRRQFLKVGLLGSATLTVAACGVSLKRQTNTHNEFLWLQSDDTDFLAALIPVMLSGALPENKKDSALAQQEIIQGIDISIAHMQPSVRDEVRRLFWLLEFTPTRIVLAGIFASWDKADPQDILSFITSWKESDFDLLRVGYAALHDLISGSWYANPRAWSRIQYPGPPALA